MGDEFASSKEAVVHSAWYLKLAAYEKPDARKATLQILNTLGPYALLWVAMVWMLRSGMSYWLLPPLILLAGFFLVRVFIIFHDCGHGSFFSSRRANTVVGFITGVLTFTPYDDWRHQHAGHHATVGDLDRRGTGDVWTMTVEEYRAAPWQVRFAYRFVRNPLILFTVGPPIMFLFLQRLPHKPASDRERVSVWITNAAILAIGLAAHLTIGLPVYLMIQIPVMTVAGILGVWLFYVQHQFEGVYWARHSEWDPMRAALEGSSYYKLPGLLQWFSGNIGIHHVHHLRPRIPNYNLQRCLDEVPELRAVKPLTLRTSLKSLFLNLWDETAHKLVSFGEAAFPQSRESSGGAQMSSHR